MKTARELFEKLGYKFKEIFYVDESNYAYEYSCGGKRFIFQDLDEKGIVTDSVKYIGSDELQAVIQQIKELGWFGAKDEHFEKKQQTNFEYYEDKIRNAGFDFAVIDGEVVPCDSHCLCSNCSFDDNHLACDTVRMRWLYQLYKKPMYRLSQFEFDLLDIYKKCGTQKCIANYGTLLELNEKGHFKEVDLEAPIGEILENCEIKGE